MSSIRGAKPYQINIMHGDNDLQNIIDDLAKQTINKNTGDFIINNFRVKKNQRFRQAL